MHQDHNCLPQKCSILHKQEIGEFTITVVDYWQAQTVLTKKGYLIEEYEYGAIQGAE